VRARRLVRLRLDLPVRAHRVPVAERDADQRRVAVEQVPEAVVAQVPQARAFLRYVPSCKQQVIINAQITIILADRSIIGCAENPSIDV
jgi:hypothetical protein